MAVRQTPFPARRARAVVAVLVLGALVLSACESSSQQAGYPESSATASPGGDTASGPPGDGGEKDGEDGKGKDGKGGKDKGPKQRPDRPVVPSVHFRVVRTRHVLTGDGVRKAAARRAARLVAGKVRTALEDLHREAFLDPRNWQRGHYWQALVHFTGRARRAARKDLETLTLGRDAGDLFVRLRKAAGSMKVQVLLRPEGRPLTAAAFTRFSARADRKTGAVRIVSSRSRWFLTPTAQGWRVYAWDIRRLDHRPRVGRNG